MGFYEFKSISGVDGLKIKQFSEYIAKVNDPAHMKYIFNSKKTDKDQAKLIMYEFMTTGDNKSKIWNKMTPEMKEGLGLDPDVFASFTEAKMKTMIDEFVDIK